MRRRLALTAVTALLLAFATATVLVVSAGSAPPSQGSNQKGPSNGPVEITLSEWKIDTPAARIPAGRVVLEERNTGGVEHDLLLVRTDRDPGDLPRGLSGPSPAAAGEVVFGEIHAHSHEKGGTEGHLAPGGSRRRTVDLAPGRYVLICPLPGHYEAGQAARLVVE